MNTDWRPAVDSPRTVHVPEVFVRFSPLAMAAWKGAQPAFDLSERKDYSVYGAYGSLAEEGRLLLPHRNGPAKRFVEFFTALLLHREGFDCWSQVQLFEDRRPLFVNGKPVTKGKGNAVRNTLHVRNEMGWPWPWPSEQIQPTLAFQPRNPDIVAYHPNRGEWRFCEVKGPNDPVTGPHFREQLNALAVLHLLTRAPVAIIRPIPDGCPTSAPSTYKATIKYKRGARLDWIRVGAGVANVPRGHLQCGQLGASVKDVVRQPELGVPWQRTASHGKTRDD